jgi:metallo-beta-lactamase superfamily protein
VTMATLTGLVIHTYRIGFGDCFLLRFEYGRKARHVLVDYGTSASPERMGSQTAQIAAHIEETCGGKLDAIVATHRHGDHVSGFAGATWSVIARLGPGLVVLPWTEHPDAATDAEVAPTGTRGKIGARSCAHVGSLDAMHEVADAALRELGRRAKVAPGSDEDEGTAPEEAEVLGPWAARDLGPSPVGAPFGKRLAAELRLVGGLNLKNQKELDNLRSTPAQDYVAFGSRSRLARLLPGVKVHVLGPPTLAQSSAIRHMREVDRAEYWHVMAAAGRASARAGGRPLFPGVRTVSPDRLPLETRWFLKRVDAVRAGELLQIVRALDEVLNNTSVILLFEIPGPGGKKLLFPGDAQLENWSYALSHPEVRELLKGVDVYKVGHHGSLNATPKTMWNGFERRGPAGTPGRLVTLLSTRKGKHGRRENGTEVPRGPLVEELEARSALVSTLEMTGAKDFVRSERII